MPILTEVRDYLSISKPESPLGVEMVSCNFYHCLHISSIRDHQFHEEVVIPYVLEHLPPWMEVKVDQIFEIKESRLPAPVFRFRPLRFQTPKVNFRPTFSNDCMTLVKVLDFRYVILNSKDATLIGELNTYTSNVKAVYIGEHNISTSALSQMLGSFKNLTVVKMDRDYIAKPVRRSLVDTFPHIFFTFYDKKKREF